jgi:adenine-specific DNA-methyltransferase
MSKGRKTTAGAPKQVETLTHKEAKRKNIPTAELQSAAQRVWMVVRTCAKMAANGD